jgi:3',5'-cyclic AMP phosphodiesterase CpdA
VWLSLIAVGLLPWLLLIAGIAHADDRRITVAVIPDTQAETYQQSAARARWIAARDFDAVAHVGDVTNWGAQDWTQFRNARRWMALLPDVPRAVAVGNHDTAAVGVGGSAFDPPRTGELLRDTTAFNRARLVTTRPYRQWERGRVDNSWTRINRQWAMLTLELWPRPGAVDWANSVIRKRPGTKWIIVTHACLNPAGRITGYSGYGSTSPAYLRDRLVRPNRNVRVVLCGHIGRTAVTKDRHATWMLTNRTDPGRVRILDIDGSTIRTRMAR